MELSPVENDGYAFAEPFRDGSVGRSGLGNLPLRAAVFGWHTSTTIWHDDQLLPHR